MSAAFFIVPQGYRARPGSLAELSLAQSAMRCAPGLDLVAAIKSLSCESLLPQGCIAAPGQLALHREATALMRAAGAMSYIAAVKLAQQRQAESAGAPERMVRPVGVLSASGGAGPHGAPHDIGSGTDRPAASRPPATALDLWLSLKEVEVHAGRAMADDALSRDAARLGATLRAVLTQGSLAAGAEARGAAISEASAWLAHNEPRIAALRTQSLQAAEAATSAAYRAHQQRALNSH